MEINTQIPQVCANQSLGLSNFLISLMAEAIISAPQCNLSPPEMWPPDYGPYIEQYGLPVYDFIIIGAGSAGSVLASRLTENPQWKVLVLEAGGNPPAETEVPVMNPTLTTTSLNWGLTGKTSQNFGQNYPNGVRLPTGKMLGGTGSFNGMVYARGNKRDYDRWEAKGNANWNWKTVLKYFRKSEKMLSLKILRKSGLIGHGIRGPMKVDYYHHKPDPLDKLISKALEDVGLRDIVDYTTKDHVGYARLAAFVAGGRRQSSGKVFLGAARNRRNLHVIKYAHVTSLVTGNNSKILEVRFNINGTNEYVARASKEYILSAGVFNTPQILMLSGIGPKEHLEKMGIGIYKDLKVGYNFQDHVMISYQFRIPNYRSLIKWDVLEEYRNYLRYRIGAFSGPYTADFNAFINSINSTSPFPNVQMVYVIADQRLQELTKYNSVRSKSSTSDVQNVTVIANMLLLNPRSRGYVQLNSTNPSDLVSVYPDLLTDPEDVEELVKAIRWQQKLLQTRPFKQYNVEEVRPTMPNSEAEYDSDLFWEDYVRKVSSAGWHGVGTCKMGPKSDPDAVVGPDLKVRQIVNLRIADASVIPYLPSGNTYAPTLMIAERAADFIKEDWKRSLNAIRVQ